uniref:Uncharacterized protein n=1 Tax=Arundo donax TaxID=35708 RepID=A0A0A9CAP7_ARUDO
MAPYGLFAAACFFSRATSFSLPESVLAPGMPPGTMMRPNSWSAASSSSMSVTILVL